MKNKSFLFVSCLVASLVITSCNSSLSSLTISSENDVHSLEVGQTLQLNVSGDKEIKNSDVSWESGNIDVASVDQNGLVTTLLEGNATINAYYKENRDIKAEYKIVVVSSSKEIEPTSIAIVSSKNIIKVDEVINVAIRTTPENASDKVDYSVSDSSILSVNVNGQVKGLKEGKAKVIATSKLNNSVKGELEITVEASEVIPSTDYENMAYSTHEEYINAEKNSALKVKGVCKYVVDYQNKSSEDVRNYYLLNDKGGFYIYGQSTSLGEVIEGKTYEVGGFKKVYNGTHEVVNIEYLNELSTQETYITSDISTLDVSSLDAMEQYQGGLVEVKGAVVSSLPTSTSKAYSIKTTINNKAIDFRVDPANMGKETFNAIVASTNKLTVGASFDVIGVMSAYGYGTPKNQIALLEDTIKASELSNDKKVDLVKEATHIKACVDKDVTKIDLPLSHPSYDGVTISWSSSDTSVISNTGTITHGTIDKDVTLTATFKCNEITKTQDYIVTVLMSDDSSLEVVHLLDFEDASTEGQYGCSITKSGYGKGNVTLGKPTQKVWTLDEVLIETGTSAVINGINSGRARGSASIYNVDPIEASAIEFVSRQYNSGNIETNYKISYSSDGTNYTEIDRVYYCNKDLNKIRVTLPASYQYIKISKFDNNSSQTFNIDDITLYK